MKYFLIIPAVLFSALKAYLSREMQIKSLFREYLQYFDHEALKLSADGIFHGKRAVFKMMTKQHQNYLIHDKILTLH